MPTVDFGTVRAFVDDDRIDVFFPRGNDGLQAALKEMKGRWNPERRCWTVVPRFARKSREEVVDRIGETLLAAAPDGWKDAVDKFGGFACATRRYEIKVGIGGIRIRLPDGHPSHWVLKSIEGCQRDGESWLLPARSCAASVIRPVLERVVREDYDFFISHIEHLEGRSIRGVVPVKPYEANELGLEPGKYAHADYAFLKIADPQVRNGPVHSWPFMVASRRDMEDGADVRLAYPDPDIAYKAVRHRMAMAPEDRQPLLDITHATGKWSSRLD